MPAALLELLEALAPLLPAGLDPLEAALVVSAPDAADPLPDDWAFRDAEDFAPLLPPMPLLPLTLLLPEPEDEDECEAEPA